MNKYQFIKNHRIQLAHEKEQNKLIDNDQIIKMLNYHNIDYRFFAFDLYAIAYDDNSNFKFNLLSGKTLKTVLEIIRTIK